MALLANRCCKVVCVFAMVLGGCDTRTPKASSEDLAALRASQPGISKDCVERVRYGGFVAMPEEIDQCFEMDSPRYWRGTWGRDFELSRFCEGSAVSCSYGGREAVWLEFAKEVELPRGLLQVPTYRIEFVGRLTSKPGGFGHLNGYGRAIVVDKIIRLAAIPKRRS